VNDACVTVRIVMRSCHPVVNDNPQLQQPTNERQSIINGCQSKRQRDKTDRQTGRCLMTTFAQDLSDLS